MGLIKAIKGAVSGNLADQWEEYFYCDSLDSSVLMTKASKKIGGKSQNIKGQDNIISKGSVIAVADGQCMLIIDNGKIAEVCAEPGEFVYDSSTEPSIFAGNLGEAIGDTFKNIGKRFVFGGEPPKDQRVYFINTKEIMGNKYGTAQPIPFRVVDKNIGLDVDISVKCYGEYSYIITNPLLFYTNVAGNVTGDYRRSSIDEQFKSELLTSLQPAFAQISAEGVRYSALPGYTQKIADSLNDIMSEKWRDLRGIEVKSFGMSSVTASDEDQQMIKDLQKTAVLRDPGMGAATLVGAQAEAMKAAAANKNGAMMGFMGMGMAQQAGGSNINDMYAAAAQAPKAAPVETPVASAAPVEENIVAAAAAWKCTCGTDNTSKFCMECGLPKPEALVDDSGWTCSCGTVNKGKFCMNCGTKKPVDIPTYQCDKCGWIPEDPHNPPKFCPDCGDPFNDEDIVK